MSKYNLIDILEGMTDKEFNNAEEAERLENHPERDTIKKIQSLMAKEKSLKEDAIEDESVTEGDEAVDLAIEASQKKAGIKEARVDREVAERIEGLTNQELKRKFLFAFEDLYSDLTEEDPFHAEDVINHLNNEMHKHLKDYQDAGGKLEEAIPGENEDGTPKSNDEMGDDEREDFYNDLDSVDEGSIDKVSMKDVVLALIKDAKGTNPEIDSYVKSLKQSGDEFDSVEDYVEDFKEYVSNKSLSEHFGRFMKDYQ